MRAPYLNDGDVRLYLGDCIEVMGEMDPESVDAVVCDPPYGLEFMGKEWDAPWRDGDVLRNPASVGGFQDGAGGNPYSRSRIRYGRGSGFQDWCEQWAAAAYRVLKPGGHLLAFGGTRTFHRLTCGIEDAGFEIRDCLSYLYSSGFPKSLDVSKAIDKAAGAEREVIGSDTKARSTNGKSALPTVGGTTVYESWDITAPATDAAREWQGWGTALKPAWEPCVVARKPLVGTVAANVQAHGTGAINVDGCRIAGVMDGTWGATQHSSIGYGADTAGSGFQTQQHPAGRWPANVTLDEDAAALLDAQSGDAPAKPQRTGRMGGGKGALNMGRGGEGIGTWPADPGGGASRFYYTAKASRSDRNAGGLADNTHPTVKPTDLMRWLVRLVTPPGGVVLDPFAGSGSTLVAARAEGFRAIGIEREEEYARIISDRLSQLSLFSEAS